MRRAFKIGGAAVLAGTVFLAGAVRHPAALRGDAIPILGSDALFARAGGGSSGQTIAVLQDRLRRAPSDWRAAAALGLAFVQQARMTGDPTSYPRAEEALRRSLSLNHENTVGLVGMGSLALARHDFREALDWGRRAVSADPHGQAGYGVLGDALVELGRYREGFQAFQRMVDLRPDLSSYTRASYARELQGDLAGAIGLMRMAEEAAGSPQDAAWAAFELGELFWSTGRIRDAAASYRRASRLAPSFLAPRTGLARVSWARGRMDDAIRRYRLVVARFPAPEYVTALGDLYAATGRPERAEDQFALVRAEEDLFEANGVNVDLELALFDADHGRTRVGLRAARAAWSERKSIHAADAVAWALHKRGRDGQAAHHARRAFRLGTRSSLFLFHAGMIELRLGHHDRARRLLQNALRANPHFSILHAGTARRALARLEGSR
jgi:tetratricopeptide (TPR) repeat protein